jgi:hypothetical protein
MEPVGMQGPLYFVPKIGQNYTVILAGDNSNRTDPFRLSIIGGNAPPSLSDTGDHLVPFLIGIALSVLVGVGFAGWIAFSIVRKRKKVVEEKQASPKIPRAKLQTKEASAKKMLKQKSDIGKLEKGKVSLEMERKRSKKIMSSKRLENIKILQPIGKGKFGEVFIGEWEGTSVALKKLALGNKEDFEKEVSVLR